MPPKPDNYLAREDEEVKIDDYPQWKENEDREEEE